ncbi:MAG: hypothetical protein HC897_19200, partial [Thermoanaerobaculia bacterium]|nr:hypothetical protein [Thermoanaerobaculia bacterium]
MRARESCSRPSSCARTRSDTVALDPRRPRALAGGKNTAVLWNSETGAYQLGLDIDLGTTVDVALFDPTGELLLTAGRPRAALLWEASTGELVGSLEGHSAAVVDADFSEDGVLILTASADGSARLWDARGAKLLAAYVLGQDAPVRRVLARVPRASRSCSAMAACSAGAWFPSRWERPSWRG